MIFKMGGENELTKSNTISMFIYLTQFKSYCYSHAKGRKYGRITFSFEDDTKSITYRVLPRHMDALFELKRY